MNSNFTYRITAILLACLMFITSVSFAVDMHYCKGQFKSFSLLGKAKNCHELAAQAAAKPCPFHQKMKAASADQNIDVSNCCKNKTLHIDAEDERQVSEVSTLNQQHLVQFIAAYIYTFLSPPLLEKEQAAYALYKPPLIHRSIPVFTQSFLL